LAGDLKGIQVSSSNKPKTKWLVVHDEHVDEGDTLEQAWEEACSYHGVPALDLDDTQIYEAREIQVELKLIEKKSPIAVG
jgi:hypothetical protein